MSQNIPLFTCFQRRGWSWGGMVLLLVLLASCQERPLPLPPATPVDARSSLEPVPWLEAPPALFEDAATQSWARALEGSADYYRRSSPDKLFYFGPYEVSAATMARACTTLAETAQKEDPSLLQEVLIKQFRLFRSVGSDGRGEVLVTGYYEPLLRGSRTHSKRYFYPIYGRPTDLLTADLGLWSLKWKGKKLVARVQKGQLLPYYERSQIDGSLSNNGEKKGKLAGQGLELVWVDNAVDAFFLQIQGSGRVILEGPPATEDTVLRLGYDSANGRSYRSIGKVLIDEGQVSREEMTMPRLRQWLEEHPEEVQRLLFSNPSYVFFRFLKGGPLGNIQVALTPERSIATDHRLFPRGAPSILVTTAPLFAKDGKTVAAWKPDVRFTVNQDTGGAIRGAGRVDLFLGFGPQAENWAGVMKQQESQLFFIAPL